MYRVAPGLKASRQAWRGFGRGVGMTSAYCTLPGDSRCVYPAFRKLAWEACRMYTGWQKTPAFTTCAQAQQKVVDSKGVISEMLEGWLNPCDLEKLPDCWAPKPNEMIPGATPNVAPLPVTSSGPAPTFVPEEEPLVYDVPTVYDPVPDRIRVTTSQTETTPEPKDSEGKVWLVVGIGAAVLVGGVGYVLYRGKKKRRR